MSKEKGQTLVEFALILPILLLVIFVIIESGRIFQAYITVQHAAREGTRYAVTGRWEEELAGEPDPRVASIEDAARNALTGLVIDGPAGYDADARILRRHYEIKIFGQNPDPLGPPLLEGYAGLPNEKVAVQVAYRLEIITPVLNVIAPSVQVVGYVEMINEDFGQLGGGGFAALREPPTPISNPIPTAGASPTPTETPTGTITPTPTETGTPTETPTPTATPACALSIEEPVSAADKTVTVRGNPGDFIELRDMYAGGSLIGTGEVVGSAYCNSFAVINVNLTDRHGHVIAAIAANRPSSDTACVGVTACWPTSTPTTTPTITPTPTATPTGPYIALDRTCSGPAGKAVDITVSGDNWLASPGKSIFLQWDGTQKKEFASRVNWSTVINITASEATSGTHTVTALILAPRTEDSQSIVIPCPPTPPPPITATPLRPDLRITGIDVSPSSVITAYVPVSFTVNIKNDGPGDALSLFWVDLYVDPTPAPPDAGQTNGDAAWTAVSSLGAGDTRTVILYHYFTDPGPREVYGYVDTRENVDETDEDNNAWGLLNLEITAGTPPSATLTVDPGCIYTTSVPMTITVSGQGWPDTGINEIQYDGSPKVSTSGASWSTDINLDGNDTAPRSHNIQVKNGPVIKTHSYMPCSMLGAIDGYTWIFIEGRVVPHERADVYCLDADGDPIAQTTSDDDAYYDIKVPPGGTYTVIGQTYIDDVLYRDTKTGVQVGGVITTTRVNLVLLPQY